MQHGRDIGSYFARGDHPVKRIVACESDGCNPENRENFDHYLNDYVLRATRITMERLGGKAQYLYGQTLISGTNTTNATQMGPHQSVSAALIEYSTAIVHQVNLCNGLLTALTELQHVQQCLDLCQSITFLTLER